MKWKLQLMKFEIKNNLFWIAQAIHYDVIMLKRLQS